MLSITQVRVAGVLIPGTITQVRVAGVLIPGPPHVHMVGDPGGQDRLACGQHGLGAGGYGYARTGGPGLGGHRHPDGDRHKTSLIL